MSAGEVSELDELMPAETRCPIRDREMSFAREDREARSELRRVRAGGVDDCIGFQDLFTTPNGARQNLVYADRFTHRGAMRNRVVEQPASSRRRIDHRIAVHEQAAGETRTQLWLMRRE